MSDTWSRYLLYVIIVEEETSKFLNEEIYGKDSSIRIRIKTDPRPRKFETRIVNQFPDPDPSSLFRAVNHMSNWKRCRLHCYGLRRHPRTIQLNHSDYCEKEESKMVMWAIYFLLWVKIWCTYTLKHTNSHSPSQTSSPPSNFYHAADIHTELHAVCTAYLGVFLRSLAFAFFNFLPLIDKDIIFMTDQGVYK